MARNDCNTDCGWKYPFNGGARASCRSDQACSCRCGPLKSINPNLYDGCIDACQSIPRPASPQDYMCNYVGGEVLYSYYGIVDCGFDIEEAGQHQQTEEQKNNLKFLQAAGIVMGAIVVIMIVNLIFPKR